MSFSEKNYIILQSNYKRVIRYSNNTNLETKNMSKYINYLEKLLKTYNQKINWNYDSKMYVKDTLEFKNKIKSINKQLNELLQMFSTKYQNRKIILQKLKNLFEDIISIL